jgi:hypothetical protein
MVGLISDTCRSESGMSMKTASSSGKFFNPPYLNSSPRRASIMKSFPDLFLPSAVSLPKSERSIGSVVFALPVLNGQCHKTHKIFGMCFFHESYFLMTLIFLAGKFRFFRKFAKILTTQGAPPESMTAEGSGKKL